MHPPAFRTRRAFTLIELLVVVAIIALLIAILLPSLARAREQTKSVKCLSNLGQWGKAVVVYTAENRDILPGDSHPAIFRWQGIDALTKNEINSFTVAQAQQQQVRFLSYKLRKQFNDSDGTKKSLADEIATCPTLAGINPDSQWISHKKITNKSAFPTHYVLNNWGPGDIDEVPSGAVGNLRTTNPPHYFGLSTYSNDEAQEAKFPPQPLSKIRRPAEEWMIADAWYRRNDGFPASPYYQQEAPYQSGWSGTAMPNFAPHFAKRSSYGYQSDAIRDNESSIIRTGRQDGKTNTVFFDGHAEAIPSQVCRLVDFELLYGFRGTVNLPCAKVPYDPGPDPLNPLPCDAQGGEIPYWQ